MKVIVLVLIAISFTTARAQVANECPNSENWKPTEGELQAILANHEEWLARGGFRGNGRANLCNADLRKVDLQEANLENANLSGARLNESNLQKANLSSANLQVANLSLANLHRADLSFAKLREARLQLTILTEARLFGADISGSLYQPATAPSLGHLATIIGLSTVTFCPGESSGLVLLRAALRNAGLRDLEREATFALESVQTDHAFARWGGSFNDAFPNCLDYAETDRWATIEGVLRRIFFELTTKWGMQPARALWIIAAFILILTPAYWQALVKPGADGIWRDWSKDRQRQDLGTNNMAQPIELHGLRAWRTALYFSLLSAFNIGWRDLNVGNWIARIQRYEYTYKATGWVRTVSGIQSLMSVYLLAIWALTYFGRPFG